MRFLYEEIQSKIRYKIIMPFLLLTLLVAAAGSAVALRLAAGTQQERFNNQVADVARFANDTIVEQEISNLDFLNQIVFAPENTANGAPPVSQAIAERNVRGLINALDPFMNVGMRSSRVNLDRLMAFDLNGNILVDMERASPDPSSEYLIHQSFKLPTNPGSFVGRILNAQPDQYGDKFAGLMRLPTPDGTEEYYFATVAPVYVNEQVVGGMILSMRAGSFLEKLATRSGASVIVVYDSTGQALFSTRIPEGAADVPDTESDDSPTLVSDSELPTIQIGENTLEKLRSGTTEAEQSVLDVITINQRPYQVAFTPLIIRRVQMGYIAAGLSNQYMLDTVADLQGPITLITIALMAGIVWLGSVIARNITTPLEELVATTQDVTAGNWRRRSSVQTRDEIATLSQSFNTMTGHLLSLYGRVQAEASQRAAIVDSIADGIVVCNPDGTIRIINHALRQLIGLTPDDPLPTSFSDLPLIPLSKDEGAFGAEQSSPLYTIGGQIVRISDARVTSVDGSFLGEVYVLHNLTAEFNIDRAKTEFIGTISHELRTPITTLRGTTELLLRGMFGPVEGRQAQELSLMLQKLTGMTTLINNVIAVADIEAGALTLELEPLEVEETIEEAAWKLQKSIKEKGLTFTLDIPADIPPVIADYDHFHTIIQQLVENARLYTDEGGITIHAQRDHSFVQIDVCDTGCGIAPEMYETIFERFVRGTGEGEGVDSQDRGIGLGLTIVRYLVQQHGGQIWVTSEPGKGSVFSFTLRHSDAPKHPDRHNEDISAAAGTNLSSAA